jgi:hypothetical protein
MLLNFMLSIVLTLAPVLLSQNVVCIPGPCGSHPASGTVTWTLVQHPNNFTCNASGTTVSSASCTLSGITAPAAGHAFIVAVTSFDDNISIAPSLSSVVGNNGSDTTLTHCPSTAATLQYIASNWVLVDCYYVAVAAGGTTSFTATVNFGSALTTPGQWQIDVELVEVSRSIGTATIDVGANSTNSGTACSSCSAPSLSITGGSDYILQIMNDPQQFTSSISGSYSNPFDNDTTNVAAAFAGALNQSSGTGPTWTMAGSTKVAMGAVSFK